jgi:hypothetical protein
MIATVIGNTLILSGIALDLLSLFLGIRRILRNGPSGVPVVPLLLYFFGTFVLSMGHSSIAVRLFGVLVVVHILCQFVILLIVAAVVKWRQRKPNNTS